MAHVRYLGMVVGEAVPSDAVAAEDARFGRFVTMNEPMPVGTLLDIDGAAFFVTRVDEGTRNGCWLWPDGAARAHIDDGPTVPTPAVEPEERVIMMIADDPSQPIRLAPTPEAPPPMPDPATPSAAPEPTPDEPGPGGKKRKRRAKTVMGR